MKHCKRVGGEGTYSKMAFCCDTGSPSKRFKNLGTPILFLDSQLWPLMLPSSFRRPQSLHHTTAASNQVIFFWLLRMDTWAGFLSEAWQCFPSHCMQFFAGTSQM